MVGDVVFSLGSGDLNLPDTLDQPVYRPGWTDLWTDIVSCPSVPGVFNINITKMGKPRSFMDGTRIYTILHPR